MIDNISFRTETTRDGRTYDVVRLWISGIPFQANLVGDVMQRTVHRIAEGAGCAPVADLRAKATEV